jgi:antitoxin (DNA-binding transcriptional repressor) of toxin-antitoxin stability system
MKATVSNLKNNLSAYLRKVRAGSAIVIYDRDVPIARLERIEETSQGADRLKLLQVQGLTRPPRRPMSSAKVRQLLKQPLAPSSRLLNALLADRAEDR